MTSANRRAKDHEDPEIRPARSASERCCVEVLRTADRVGRVLSEPVDAHGLTMQQYNVLRILRGAYPEGLPTLEIADRMIKRHPNVTRLLDRLEDKALVVRERCDDDRRIVRAWISDTGRRLLADIDEPMAEMADRVFEGMAPEERSQLMTLLSRLRPALTLDTDDDEDDA